MYACAGVDTLGAISNTDSSGLRCEYIHSKEFIVLGPSKLMGMYVMYIGV